MPCGGGAKRSGSGGGSGRSACATLLTGRLQMGCVVTLTIAHNRFRRHRGFLEALQQRVEFFAPDRFGEVAIHAGVHAALVVALHGVRGHGDDGLVPAGAALTLADRGGGFEAVHLGHLYVHQHQMSISTRSNASDSSAATASRPLRARVILWPRFSSIRTASFWFTGLSSATRIFRLHPAPFSWITWRVISPPAARSAGL